MLESIFTGLTQGIASMFDKVITTLFGMLTFDMESALLYMPVIADFYDILQWVGLGLIFAIATFQLGKFFFGSLVEIKDSPIRILVRSALATALVYVGNYGLQLIFDLFSYPMSAMLGVDTVYRESVFELISKTGFLPNLDGVLIAFIAILALGWNLMKLILEAVERWLMLCVLTYTSPLAFSTVASEATTEIFKKWFSMVIGQCILMLSNVWSLKIILNVMCGIDAHPELSKFLFTCAVALGLSRIAQSLDSHLQRLGISSATTGGSMLDTMLAVGGSLVSGVNAVRKGISNNTNVLGKRPDTGDSDTKNDPAPNSKPGRPPQNGGGDGTAGEYVRQHAGLGKEDGSALSSGGASSPDGNHSKDLSSAPMGGGSGKGDAVPSDPADAVHNAAKGTSSGGNSSMYMHPGKAGMTAARNAIREGKSSAEAKTAALAAYDAAVKKNAAMEKNASTLNTKNDAKARKSFSAGLDSAIKKMKDEASTMTIRDDGNIRNGFGDVQSHLVSGEADNDRGTGGTTDSHPAEKGQNPANNASVQQPRQSNDYVIKSPTAAAARMIYKSANSQAAEDGSGFDLYMRNPDPNAYDENGKLKPGHSAEVYSRGTQLAVNTINTRGSDLADEIIRNKNSAVDNHAVAAAAFKNSSYSDTGYEDINASLEAMDQFGSIPAARDADPKQGIEAVPDRGAITDMKTGNGVTEFTYEAPAQQQTVDKVVNGQHVQAVEKVQPNAETVTVRTPESFASLSEQEQAQYHENRSANGTVSYIRRVPIQTQDSDSASGPNRTVSHNAATPSIETSTPVVQSSSVEPPAHISQSVSAESSEPVVQNVQAESSDSTANHNLANRSVSVHIRQNSVSGSVITGNVHIRQNSVSGSVVTGNVHDKNYMEHTQNAETSASNSVGKKDRHSKRGKK